MVEELSVSEGRLHLFDNGKEANWDLFNSTEDDASTSVGLDRVELQNLALTYLAPEDGIRDVERSRGLGDVYKRQIPKHARLFLNLSGMHATKESTLLGRWNEAALEFCCLPTMRILQKN